MKGYFFPDTNHDDRTIIQDFVNLLPELKSREVGVVYLEFQYEKVWDDWRRFEDDFSYCSGGRNVMAKPYFEIVRTAKQLGLEMIGLSRQGYFQMKQRDHQKAFAFRSLLPFDGIAAETILRTNKNRPFVVFLGSGHWPLLTKFVWPLVKVYEINQPDPDPTLAQNADNIAQLPKAIAETRNYVGDDYIDRVIQRIPEAHDRLMKSIAWEDASDTPTELMQRFQDKFGVPPTLLQLNQLLALRLQPNIIWTSRISNKDLLAHAKKQIPQNKQLSLNKK